MLGVTASRHTYHRRSGEKHIGPIVVLLDANVLLQQTGAVASPHAHFRVGTEILHQIVLEQIQLEFAVLVGKALRIIAGTTARLRCGIAAVAFLYN